MKRFFCFLIFCSASILVTGCASLETRLQDFSIAYHVPRTVAHGYRCVGLEFEMCSLIEAAAAVATAEGYIWYRDDVAGDLWFGPGPTRTALWGGDPADLVPYVSPGLYPHGIHKLDRFELGNSSLVELNVRRGGIAVRDSDIVDMLVDEFERGRKK